MKKEVRKIFFVFACLLILVGCESVGKIDANCDILIEKEFNIFDSFKEYICDYTGESRTCCHLEYRTFSNDCKKITCYDVYYDEDEDVAEDSLNDHIFSAIGNTVGKIFSVIIGAFFVLIMIGIMFRLVSGINDHIKTAFSKKEKKSKK